MKIAGIALCDTLSSPFLSPIGDYPQLALAKTQ